MVEFVNSFFSWAGQKERLGNVKDTLIASLTGKGVSANTGNATADKILSTAASHPLATASIITPIKNPTATANFLKSTAQQGIQAFASSSLKTKLVTAVVTPVAVGAVVKEPTLITNAAKLPGELANFGGNIASAVKNPSVSSVSTIFKENPYLSTATALTGIATVGGGVGLAANTLSTLANTNATKKNTESPTEPIMTRSELPSQAMIEQLPKELQGAFTNKYDVDIAQINAKVAKDTNETAIELAKLQAQNTATNQVMQSNPLTSATPTQVTPIKKATPKKKTTKKRTKKKSTKKKTTKKKATKKKSKKHK